MDTVKFIIEDELNKYCIETFNKNFSDIANYINTIFNKLNNVPTNENIPTKLSELSDDIGIVQLTNLSRLLSTKVDLTQYDQIVTVVNQINNIVYSLSKVAVSGEYKDLLGKPELGDVLKYDIIKKGV